MRSSQRCASVYLLAAALAQAGIPEPDATFYGSLHIGLQLVPQSLPVTVLAKMNVDRPPPGPSPNDTNGQLVGSYRMGDNKSAGDRYVLKIKLESLADGSDQSGDAALLETPRSDVEQVRANALNLRRDLSLRPAPDGYERDDRRDADHDAQNRQARAQLIRVQAP